MKFPHELTTSTNINLVGWLYHRGFVVKSDYYKFRSIVLSNEARHSLIAYRISDLIAEWNRSKIIPFMFKGFPLAQFVYNHSSERFYGDVDILFPMKDAISASEIAKKCGWNETHRLDENSALHDHEFCHLYSNDRLCRIDVHLDLLQIDSFFENRWSLTQAVYEASIEETLFGAVLRVPQPVDHIIILLINRRWGDRWARKATDYTDLLAIQERYGVTREDVLARAKELGCYRNIALTLETCDPWLKKLKLGHPPRWQQILWDWQCSSELGSYEFDYYAERLRQAPSRIWHVWHSLPHLFEAMRKRKGTQDLEVLISQFDAKPLHEGVAPKLSQLFKWSLGVFWASKVLRLRDNPCVPKSLALLRILSRAGFAASFVSGVRKSNGKLEGHAWIEVDGLPLEADMQAPSLYKENFRYDNWVLRQRKLKASTPSDDA
jgi:Uncharacterised nucleotidyltransferase/Transglutaminase-like superfamily